VDSLPIDITSLSTIESIQKLTVMRIEGCVRLEGMYTWGLCTLRTLGGYARLQDVYAWRVCTLEGCVPFAEGGHGHPGVVRERHPKLKLQKCIALQTLNQILSVASKRASLDAQRLTPLSTVHSALMLVENFTEQEPQHTPCVCGLLGKELSRSDCIVLEFLKGTKLGNRPARPSGVNEINKIDEFPFKCLFTKVTRSSRPSLHFKQARIVCREAYLFSFTNIIRNWKDVQGKA
jgi:hypothetical protein